MSRDAALFDLVGAWYEAATDIGRWSALAKRLCDVFAADKCALLGIDFARNEAWVSAGHNINQTLIDEYVALIPHDPRVAIAVERPGRPFTCALHVDRDALRASRMYKEFLARPENDMEYTLGILEDVGPGATLGLAIYRGKAGSPFTQADCDDLGRLVPHFCNAAHVMRQLEAARAATAAMAETLDKLSVPLALVDRACHVVVVNQAMRVLAARGLLSLRHGQLWADRPEESRRLRAAITGAIDAPDAAARRVALAPVAGGTLAVHVAPVDRIDSAPGAIVCVLDPDSRYETSPQLLRRLYGLTQAEAELASQLVAGARVAEIAATRGTSDETVRTQVKAVYRKTGAADQSELAAIVARHPEFLRGGFAIAAAAPRDTGILAAQQLPGPD